MADENELRILTIDTIINRYFKDFEGLVYAMRGFMSSAPPNGLYWFEKQLNDATFFITIENLCEKIQSILLDASNTDEYTKRLCKAITIKIQDIEKLLAETDINDFKTKRIDYKVDYLRNNLTKAVFISSALPYPGKNPKTDGCWGTLETFYKAAKELFYEGNGKITNLLSVTISGDKKLLSNFKSFKLHEQALENIKDVLTALQKQEFISKNVKLPQFKKAFNESIITDKIEWVGSISALHYFINEVYKYTNSPKEKWIITCYCFFVENVELTPRKIADNKTVGKKDSASILKAIGHFGNAPK